MKYKDLKVGEFYRLNETKYGPDLKAKLVDTERLDAGISSWRCSMIMKAQSSQTRFVPTNKGRFIKMELLSNHWSWGIGTVVMVQPRAIKSTWVAWEAAHARAEKAAKALKVLRDAEDKTKQATLTSLLEAAMYLGLDPEGIYLQGSYIKIELPIADKLAQAILDDTGLPDPAKWSEHIAKQKRGKIINCRCISGHHPRGTDG